MHGVRPDRSTILTFLIVLAVGQAIPVIAQGPDSATSLAGLRE